MNDQELYILRHTVYSKIEVDARAAEALAADNGLSADSVRGRLSRADTTKNITALAKYRAQTTPTASPSMRRQFDVISRSWATFGAKQEDLRVNGQEVAGVFLADLHVPYTRWDAFDLALQIIEDVNPVYVSGQNDILDNAGFGRWDDNRPLRGKLWSNDVVNLRETESTIYTAIQSVMDDRALILGVAGNHDNWYARHLRDQTPQVAEKYIADYMEWLEQQGVLQFTNGSEENVIELSPKLVWWHGQFTSKRAETNARNTLAQFTEDGVSRSVVVGHTHRPARIDGATIGYNGVTFLNSGCLSRTKKLPYMKRAPQGWDLGIVVNWWEPGTRYERSELVIFQQRGAALVADFQGRRYATKFDDSLPEEYL